MRSRQPQRALRPVPGLALVATALLALVGQLAGAAHLLLVPHRECTLHGLEHDEEVAGEAVALAAPLATIDAALQGLLGDDHEDDRCLAAQLRKAQLCGPSLAAADAGAPPIARLAPTTAAPATPGAELLLLAPKGSPPV